MYNIKRKNMNNVYEETHDLSKLKPFFDFATGKFNKKITLGFMMSLDILKTSSLRVLQ